MTNSDFWDNIRSIVLDGFNPDGLSKLEEYADKFINGKLLFKRFSPQEQHGCAEGGSSHVIASILAGAEDSTDRVAEKDAGIKGIPVVAKSHNNLCDLRLFRAGVRPHAIDVLCVRILYIGFGETENAEIVAA